MLNNLTRLGNRICNAETVAFSEVVLIVRTVKISHFESLLSGSLEQDENERFFD